ncbi:hypothetical protein TPA0910_25090 [Streptomyces hygroscopicus subsp. sporocinereus]|uniref:Uncharacterized protein n=1 Tax=Streptomyces hygroscopicus TaxID=1912 RepID=A0ABQ3TXJ7_STRHY|nr:hypothetical protein TPA0910_25090 [Streptomyces hygroscopicus]
MVGKDLAQIGLGHREETHPAVEPAGEGLAFSGGRAPTGSLIAEPLPALRKCSHVSMGYQAFPPDDGRSSAGWIRLYSLRWKKAPARLRPGVRTPARRPRHRPPPGGRCRGRGSRYAAGSSPVRATRAYQRALDFGTRAWVG